MWAKLCMLIFYLLVLILLARLLDATTWFGAGILAGRVVDPFSLSVKWLKFLLDQRGISYKGLLEKHELAALIEASGDTKEEEFRSLADSDATATSSESEHTSSSVDFTCGSHFYEEVEDTKDSMWLVQVKAESSLLMGKASWNVLSNKLHRFGIRTGIFDCKLDRRLCANRGWLSSCFVLAQPRGNHAKANVTLYTISSIQHPQSIITWINKQLMSRVELIRSEKQLFSDWLEYEDRVSEVRVILASKLSEVPMFMSALSVKFPGRAKFGALKLNNLPSPTKIRGVELKPPEYVIVTRDKTLVYGMLPGETLDFSTLYYYITTFYPSVNDLFLVSLVITNLLAWFELFLVLHVNFLYTLAQLAWTVVKYNVLLILTWLPLLAVYQLPKVQYVFSFVLRGLQYCSASNAANFLRRDLHLYKTQPGLAICAFVLIGLCGLVVNKYFNRNRNEDELNNNLTWSFPDVPYLFRPVAPSVSRPMRTDVDLEEGIELLIERMAVPNFWLQPTVSHAYISKLPVWQYKKTCKEFNCLVHKHLHKKPKTHNIEIDKVKMVDGAVTRLKRLIMLQFFSKVFGFLQTPKQCLENSTNNFCKQCQSMRCDNSPDVKTGCESVATASSCGEISSSDDDGIESSKKMVCTGDTHSKHIDAAAPNGVLPSNECVICLESYLPSVELCALPCGHAFHRHCIYLWLTRDNHCCPVCRWLAYRSKTKAS